MLIVFHKTVHYRFWGVLNNRHQTASSCLLLFLAHWRSRFKSWLTLKSCILRCLLNSIYSTFYICSAVRLGVFVCPCHCHGNKQHGGMVPRNFMFTINSPNCKGGYYSS